MPLKDSSNKVGTNPSSSKLIVLGEDDEDDEELLKEVFSTIDPAYSLKFIRHGSKIISFLEQLDDSELPCLIVLDYNMPELNGSEILGKLRESARYSHIPKIIWSTSGSDTYRKLSLELGATEYIIKPSNIKGLTEAIKYMLSLCPV
ncbi:MAG TPA: response regulator [Chitinophagaceae bacterium]|nr:response regulator [Chitinophagaceae bacterium]